MSGDAFDEFAFYLSLPVCHTAAQIYNFLLLYRAPGDLFCIMHKLIDGKTVTVVGL
jgi:hypothetical protein